MLRLSTARVSSMCWIRGTPQIRLGRHRLSIAKERGDAGKARLRLAHPSQEAEGPPHAGTHEDRQWAKIEGPLSGRTCLRASEGINGPLCQNDRAGPRAG